MVVWLCGCVVMWLCGCVVVWGCGVVGWWWWIVNIKYTAIMAGILCNSPAEKALRCERMRFQVTIVLFMLLSNTITVRRLLHVLRLPNEPAAAACPVGCRSCSTP